MPESGNDMKKGKNQAVRPRIYVCHTYYHVYVTFLKELKLRREADGSGEPAGKADLVLSSLSNQFENLKARVESTGLFAIDGGSGYQQ